MMLNAIADSTKLPGNCTISKVARIKVILWAIVKAVTKAKIFLIVFAPISKLITNRIWS